MQKWKRFMLKKVCLKFFTWQHCNLIDRQVKTSKVWFYVHSVLMCILIAALVAMKFTLKIRFKKNNILNLSPFDYCSCSKFNCMTGISKNLFAYQNQSCHKQRLAFTKNCFVCHAKIFLNNN